MKHLKISDKNYQRLRSTSLQTARFYGLAKIHKKDTLLKPFFSIHGSSKENLNSILAPFPQ